MNHATNVEKEQHKAIGAFLEQRRSLLGFTQAKFAREFDIDVDIYRTWASGRTLPKWEQTFTFLWMLGNEGRERFNIHLGPILDMLRGQPTKERGRAFDALAMILENAPATERRAWIAQLEAAALKLSGGAQ